MNIIKISAVLTAALLTGALSATAFAAETLTTTTGMEGTGSDHHLPQGHRRDERRGRGRHHGHDCL